MKLLDHDVREMQRCYPEALMYLRGAFLREECFALACTKTRNDWQRARLRELLNCPACAREIWFMLLPEIQKARQEEGDPWFKEDK